MILFVHQDGLDQAVFTHVLVRMEGPVTLFQDVVVVPQGIMDKTVK